MKATTTSSLTIKPIIYLKPKEESFSKCRNNTSYIASKNLSAKK